MVGFGEDTPKSEFNMAVAWLNRLNYYFYMCDEASQSLNAHEWLQTLMILFRELTTEIKAEKRKFWEAKAKNLFERILDSSRNRFKKFQGGIPPDIYWELHSFDQYLREAMDNSGLLKKMQEDAARSLR